jgi:hypothetical protein
MRGWRRAWIVLLVAGLAIAASSVDEEILKDLDFFTVMDAMEDASLVESAAAGEIEDAEEADAQEAAPQGDSK